MEAVHKVVLSTNKEVLLREYKIAHNSLASKVAGTKAGENKFLFAQLFNNELLKILVAQIDGKAVKPIQLEQLDEMFTMSEYRQLMKVLDKICNDGEEVDAPKVEYISSFLSASPG